MKCLICNAVLLSHLYPRTVQTAKLARLGHPFSFEWSNSPTRTTSFARTVGTNAYTVLPGWQNQILRLGHPLSFEWWKHLHCIIWLAASNSPTRNTSFARAVETPTLYYLAGSIKFSDSDTLFRSNGTNAYNVLSGWQNQILRLGHPLSLEQYKRLHSISSWQYQILRLGYPLFLVCLLCILSVSALWSSLVIFWISSHSVDTCTDCE